MIASLTLLFCLADTYASRAAYQQVAEVARSGGQFTTPLAAMSAIGQRHSWCATPSAVTPCLVRIMPGVYDLGGNSLEMRPYVDIEGAGENMTILQGGGGASASLPNGGVVVGASNAELRFLTVRGQNSATGGNVVAINNPGTSPRLTHVTVIAADAGAQRDMIGILNTGGAEPVITDVTVSALNGQFVYGIYNLAATPKLHRVTVDSSGGLMGWGIYNTDGSGPAMDTMTVSASGKIGTYGIYNENGSSPRMTNLQVTAANGETCIGIYNGNSSPRMSHVQVTAGLGAADGATAIFNDTAAPMMTDVSAEAVSGGYGLYNDAIYNYASAPVMTDVTATATLGRINTGIRNHESAPVMEGVTATASGSEGAEDDGIYNENSAAVMTHVNATGKNGISNASTAGSPVTVTIDQSVISGSLFSIDNDDGIILNVGASRLDGPVSAAGTYRCVGAYSGEYVPLGPACQ